MPTGLNPEKFETLNTADLLIRADELQLLDPATSSLLRWSALEIDSLRDAHLEAHGVTIIERPHDVDPAEAVAIKVAIIEPRSDPKYGHTFKMPKFPATTASDADLPRMLALS